MRLVALVLLWLGVAGFGLATLCSGAFIPVAWPIALPCGIVAGALGWACWRGIVRMRRTAAPVPAGEPLPEPPPPPADAPPPGAA